MKKLSKVLSVIVGYEHGEENRGNITVDSAVAAVEWVLISTTELLIYTRLYRL